MVAVTYSLLSTATLAGPKPILCQTRHLLPARAFIRHWLPRYGIPDDIVTDRGTQFAGGAWKELMTSLGIQSHSTTAYHPQGNGLVERMYRQLKGSLRSTSQFHLARLLTFGTPRSELGMARWT